MGRTPSSPGVSATETPYLQGSLPITKGASFSLCQCSGHHSQPCPPLTHTVRMHKESMELATKEARRSPLGSKGNPQQPPRREEPGARRCLAETAERVRSTWTGAGQSAQKPQRRKRPALSDTLRAQLTRFLNALVSPHSSRLFSRLRKGPRSPSFDPHRPHTGTWVAGP